MAGYIIQGWRVSESGCRAKKCRRPLIAGVQGDDDVFERRLKRQRPEHGRERAEYQRFGQNPLPENGFECVQGRGADVAEDNANRDKQTGWRDFVTISGRRLAHGRKVDTILFTDQTAPDGLC